MRSPNNLLNLHNSFRRPHKQPTRMDSLKSLSFRLSALNFRRRALSTLSLFRVEKEALRARARARRYAKSGQRKIFINFYYLEARTQSEPANRWLAPAKASGRSEADASVAINGGLTKGNFFLVNSRFRFVSIRRRLVSQQRQQLTAAAAAKPRGARSGRSKKEAVLLSLCSRRMSRARALVARGLRVRLALDCAQETEKGLRRRRRRLSAGPKTTSGSAKVAIDAAAADNKPTVQVNKHPTASARARAAR